jgi:hypothetical protein
LGSVSTVNEPTRTIVVAVPIKVMVSIRLLVARS